MKNYRFSPIESEKELLRAITHTHFLCYKLCQQALGKYPSNSGNIGIFCHYDDEYVQLTQIRKSLTYPSDDPDLKYFRLREPIVIPSKNDIPETEYTQLYIRRPNLASPQVGDIDFYLPDEEYERLKNSIQKGTKMEGARLFKRTDLDMVELYDPDIDALAYVSTKRMTRRVRVKQSSATNL